MFLLLKYLIFLTWDYNEMIIIDIQHCLVPDLLLDEQDSR